MLHRYDTPDRTYMVGYKDRISTSEYGRIHDLGGGATKYGVRLWSVRMKLLEHFVKWEDG